MKHLKKDDGYVLVYVLIVFTILSIVAISICNAALFNLKAQKADVARMEARYAAEGELQKFVAKVEALETTSDEIDDLTEENKTAAITDAEARFWDVVNGIADSSEEVVEGVSEKQRIEITAKAETETHFATIHAEAELTVEASIEEGASEATCAMTDWEYTSYDISYEQKEVPDET